MCLGFDADERQRGRDRSQARARVVRSLAGGATLLIAILWSSVAVAAGSGPSISYCARCIAPSGIPAKLLVPRADELPGFVGAKTTLFSASSVSGWIRGDEGSAAEAEAEGAELRRDGFEQGVFERVNSPHREAVSEALVFASAQGAIQDLDSSVAADLKGFEHERGLEKFAIPAIPGSAVLGNFDPARPGASGNVFFSVGHCFFLVADVVHNAHTGAQGTKAPVAAAKLLYKRVRHLCS
jgi:hypothetical protein